MTRDDAPRPLRSDLHADACLLFAALPGDAYADARYRAMRSSLRGLCRVARVLHTGGAPPRAYDETTATVFLNDDEVLASFPHGKDVSAGIVPGNVDLMMIAATRRLPGARRFVWMEYDVMPTGDARSAFDRLLVATRTTEFAASYVSAYRDDDWAWWATLRVPAELGRAPRELAHGAFLPLTVVTRVFLEAYAAQLARGFAGHQEVTMSTVAHWLGASTLDLSLTTPPFTSHPQFGVHEPRELDRTIPEFVHPVKNAAVRARVDEALRAARARPTSARLG